MAETTFVIFEIKYNLKLEVLDRLYLNENKT